MMAEIGSEKKLKPDIFCHGMLIYPTFYQRWVDSYVKCTINYKKMKSTREKSTWPPKTAKHDSDQ